MTALLETRPGRSFQSDWLTRPFRHIWIWFLLWEHSIGSSTAFARRHLLGRSAARSSGWILHSSSTAAVEPPDHDELPAEFPRRRDVLVALEAVRKACTVTNRLQPSFADDSVSTVTKNDLSPVTVADFCAQALVLDHLHTAFPDDSFIAEESSTALYEDPNLAQQVWEATALSSLALVKNSIDLGQDYLAWDQREEGRPSRVWCLDPIDGTKGFLRGKQAGGQYCVALALLEDGVPTIGIMGCPNLPTSPTDFNYAWKKGENESNNAATRGCIFVASKNGGCYQLPLLPGSPSRRIHVTPNDESTMTPSEGRFCIGVEKFSDALGQCRGMALVMHGASALDDQGEIVLARRFDSQAKYGVLGRAGAEYYARLPRLGYQEWIWDHAAGNVVIQEAGGVMTDVEGNPIDFSLGAKLSKDVTGVLASNGGVFHEALVEAFRKQEQARLQGTPLVDIET